MSLPQTPKGLDLERESARCSGVNCWRGEAVETVDLRPFLCLICQMLPSPTDPPEKATGSASIAGCSNPAFAGLAASSARGGAGELGSERRRRSKPSRLCAAL